MKKIVALFYVFLCVLLISGCSFGGSKQAEKSTASESASSSQAAQSASSSSSGSTVANDSSDSESQATTSSAENNTSAADVIRAIRGRLQGHDDVRLPRSVPVASGKYLSALVRSSSEGYTVTFKQTDRPTKINDASLEHSKTIVTLKATSYANTSAASEQISYHQYGASDGDPVSLGYKITGYADAGAGTAGISWNEGRWMLAVMSPTSEAKDGTALAKKIVAQLEKTALPAPEPHGTVKLYTDSREDTVSWQNGRTIYSLSGTSDPNTLLSITAAVR